MLKDSAGKKGYYPILYPQNEVKYTTNGTQMSPRGQLCANCRWFNLAGNMPGVSSCQITEHHPDPILQTGWCNQWTPVPAPPELEPMEVVIVEPDESEPFSMGMDKAAPSAIGEIFSSAKEAVLNLIGRGRESENILKYGGFKALGGGLWFAAFTNNFEDREKEIIAESAHDKYINRVRMGLTPLPELWFHHIPNTRHGKAQFIGRAGHMVYGVGVFDDTDAGKEAEKAYKAAKAGDFGLSHGFTYPTWAKKGRVYHDYNTFEITTLKPQYAANLYTPFISLEEITTMPISDRDKQLIKESFPGAAGEAIIRQAESLEQKGETVKTLLGAAYKDFADTTDDSTGAKSGGGTESAAGVLLPQIVESQGDILNLVTAMEKKFTGEIKTLTDTITAQNKTITELKTALNEPAQSASGSPETVVQGKEAGEAEKEIDKKSAKQFNPLFPGMNIPLNGADRE